MVPLSKAKINRSKVGKIGGALPANNMVLWGEPRTALICLAYSILIPLFRFSYPLEANDCADPSNSLSKINADFQRMKSQFGATMVRIYAPECRDASIWRNLLHAGIQNNMCGLRSLFSTTCN
jgi:hypothetical protein